MPRRRLLLKLSGEAFLGEGGPFFPEGISRISRRLASLSDVELAIVVGGGNIMRGARSGWLDRVDADELGMLATVLNALVLRNYLERAGRDVLIQSAVSTQFTEPVSPRKAKRALSDGAIVIFAGGTGNPLVTTDTAAAIRAVSIDAELLAKASNVPGVFTADPKSGTPARLIPELSYDEFLEKRYGVMDLAAVEICKEHEVPIEVFDFEETDALHRLAAGERVGTLIH